MQKFWGIFMRKGWKQIVRWTIISVLFFFLAILAGIIVLAYVDRNHAVFREKFVEFVGVTNHYSGSDWFAACVSIVGSVISSVPGLACGVFAWVQTQRLHELEDRYHRPMLAVHHVEARFLRLGEVDAYSGDIYNVTGFSINGAQRTIIREAKERYHKWYLDFKVKFGIKNEIELNDLWVKNITLCFNDKKYDLYSKEKTNLFGLGHSKLKESIVASKKKVCQLEHKYESGQKLYNLVWNLQPEICQMDNNDFAMAIHNFINYESVRVMDFYHMKIVVELTSEFEYGKKQEQPLFLIIKLNADDCKQNQTIGVISETSNAYFLYECE